jgi:uncharacterized protein involved in exopolysaccharide biosynthesis
MAENEKEEDAEKAAVAPEPTRSRAKIIIAASVVAALAAVAGVALLVNIMERKQEARRVAYLRTDS